MTGSGVTAALTSDATTGPTSALTMSGNLTVTSGVGSGARVGIANSGYFGVAVVPSTTYTGYFYAKATAGFTGPLTVSLESTSGAVYATATIGAISTSWAKYSFTLTTRASTPSSTSNVFVISTTSASANGQTIWFGATYLFPPGYAGYNNGNNHLRTDLTEKLIAMKPAIFRVPGGNYLEGGDYANRFNWEATIGPLEDRPGHWDPWGYWSDDGFGLDEYLQMAEAVGTADSGDLRRLHAQRQLRYGPNPDRRRDLGRQRTALRPGSRHHDLGRAARANGHSAPYDVNYVEIGNEDYNSTYATRYPLFYEAIKAAFPNLKIIATSSSTGGYPYDVLDEHFYNSPQWFTSNSDFFDNQTRGSSTVFVGEYSAMEGGPTDDLTAGIGDAAWIMGLMRNSDLVTMASFAPLWVNVNSYQWSPDLIGFDGLNSYGSFSYYAQVVLSNNHGTTVVSSSEGGQSGIQTLVSRTGSEYFITLLNTNSTSDLSTINLSGLQGLQPTGTAITLASWDGSTSNSLSDPYGISPRTTTLTGLGANTSFTYTLPAHSLTVLEVEANTAPTVATPANAAPSPVTGTTATLSVFGADEGGESNLTYTWSMTSGPAAVTFLPNGANAAKNATATFTSAGSYTFTATITNPGGLTTTSSVNVTVNQTLTSIRVAGQPPLATAYDQFANPLVNQPAFNAASETITGPLTLGSNVTVFPAVGSPLTIAGRITGAGALTIDDPGKVLLSGANGYTGGTIVSDGTLVIGAANGLLSGSSLIVGAANTFNGPSIDWAAASLVAVPAADSAPAISTPTNSEARSLSPRAVAAVMAAGPPLPPWLRRAAAANRSSDLGPFAVSRPRFV